jgi:hypothetical protein
VGNLNHVPTLSQLRHLILIFLNREAIIQLYVRPTSSPLSQASVAEGRDGRLADEVKWTKFSAITWSKDSKGFVYQV